MGERPTLKAMYETAEAVRSLRAAIDAHLRDAMSAEDLRARAEHLSQLMSTNREARAITVDVAGYDLPGEARRSDLGVYARELAEGVVLAVQYAGLAKGDIDDWARRLGTQVVRRGEDGLGVLDTIRFASPATGWVFTAYSPVDRSRVSESSGWLTLHAPRGARELAVVDLVESFLWDVIEAPDSTLEIDLDVLPVVALMREDDNGNRVEIRTFRSYTGAMREAQRFEALGHKQRYWVDVKREPRW